MANDHRLRGNVGSPVDSSAQSSASAEILARHYPVSMRLARSILRHDGEAADAVQAAYSNALRHLSNFREESSLGTWFSRIVVNQCLMRLRQLRRATPVPVDVLDFEPPPTVPDASRFLGPHEELERREAARAIRSALDRLPEILSQTWILYELEGLDLRGLSAQLGITVAAAKSRLFRARAELREILRPIRDSVPPSNRKDRPGPLVACLQ